MKRLRSFLFVPGDSERKMAKGLGCGADALILDLEDAVAPANKQAARELTRATLDENTDAACSLWVRINPLDTGLAEADLEAIAGAALDGIVLPKADGPEDVARLSEQLDRFDPTGAIRILPVATETAIAPFNLGDYARVSLPRLWGLTWGAEDLATALGATTNTDESGRWAFTYQLVRSLCLMASRAAGVQPVETLHVDFRDDAGLRRTTRAARAEGFTARLAIHPAQVDGINEGFTPEADEISHARKVIEAFAADPGAGTVGLDGKMLDRPHLTQAEDLLALAKSLGLETN